MKKLLNILLPAMLLSFTFAAAPSVQAGTRIGGGIHYLRTVGDIKDSPGLDPNDVGIMGSILFTGTLLRLEGDVEAIPDFGGSDKVMWQPQAYAMIGDFIYGGVGVGIGYFDGDWQTNPFYALRAGVDFFAGGLDLDVFASYRFQKSSDLRYLGDNLNSITFGALLRFGSR
jgi:hypothetical protein